MKPIIAILVLSAPLLAADMTVGRDLAYAEHDPNTISFPLWSDYLARFHGDR